MAELKFDKLSGSELLDAHDHIGARAVREHLKDVIRMSQYENKRVVITEHRQPAAAVVSISDLKLIEHVHKLGIAEQIADMSPGSTVRISAK